MATKGKDIKIQIPGTATAMVGEATTGAGDTVYTITDTAKRALEYDGDISVHKYDGSPDTAEAGTTTTNIKMTAHGLAEGDLIINTTRDNAKRLVTAVVDVDNITVSAVTDQTTGDTIQKCPTESESDYSLNRLKGTVTYESAVSRVIYVSGNYLPLSELAQGKEFSVSLSAKNEPISIFGDDYENREQTQKDSSASIGSFYYDDTNLTFLTDDVVCIFELYIDRDSNWHIRLWIRISSDDISGAVDGLIEESIELEGICDEDGNSVAFNE